MLNCWFSLWNLSLQHLSYGNGSLHVDAAFQQTLWSVAPICSGSEVGQGKPVCQSICLCFFPPSISLNLFSLLVVRLSSACVRACIRALICACLASLNFNSLALISRPLFFCSPALLLAGFLIGGDVLRLLHGHMDECLTVPSGEHGDEQRR